MDERLASILGGIGADQIAKVAAGALGVDRVHDPGTLTLSEISKPHADERTIGIVRVTGMAKVDPGGPPRSWSSVTKIIDVSVVGFNNSFTSPEAEEAVYERKLFADTELSFRPARCYHISHPDAVVKVLWLEDLSRAKGAPFEPGDLAQVLHHLGEWNAVVARDPPALGFSIPRDFPKFRWDRWNYPDRNAALRQLADDPMVRQLYARQPLDVATAFISAMGELTGRSVGYPHALSFSDAPIGNFFVLPGETVAVDWSGLRMDPLGGDGGCVVGSAITWGRMFAEIAAREGELFDSYLNGLADGGLATDRRAIRRGYLAHMGFYLGCVAIFPTMAAGPLALFSPSYFEQRFDMPLDEFCRAASTVIDRLPGYTQEALDLLAG